MGKVEMAPISWVILKWWKYKLTLGKWKTWIKCRLSVSLLWLLLLPRAPWKYWQFGFLNELIQNFSLMNIPLENHGSRTPWFESFWLSLILSRTHHLIINFSESQMPQLQNRDDDIDPPHRALQNLNKISY